MNPPEGNDVVRALVRAMLTREGLATTRLDRDQTINLGPVTRDVCVCGDDDDEHKSAFFLRRPCEVKGCGCENFERRA
jgi:Arc/MetJ-type ribon-helix-helix transcriptional regulator